MTIEELKNMNVKIRGYTMPDDNAPDFYKRCKVCEALDIMRDFEKDVPKYFPNLAFEFYNEDEIPVFGIERDFKTIFLGRDNNFNLTKEEVKKALGIE